MTCCPTCGRPKTRMDVGDVNFLDAIPMQRKSRLLLDALVDAYPKHVSLQTLEQWLWEDDGYSVPECASRVFTHVSKTRKILERSGWTIKAVRFQGWRLVKLDRTIERSAA